MEYEQTTGYFGKIPAKGDFLTGNLSMDFTEPWDLWMRDVLAHSKAQLQEDWQDCYLTAPIYHFALSSGICGNSTWVGVLMPSVDSVGRYFPMTICQSHPARSNTLTLLESESQWLQSAEALLLSCLDDDFSLEQFEEKLTTPNVEDDGDTTISLKKTTMHKFEDKAWGFPVHEAEKINVLYPELLNDMLTTFYANYSVWRTNGSETVDSRLVLCEGLPAHNSCTALFDGQWSKWGWSDEQIIR